MIFSKTTAALTGAAAIAATLIMSVPASAQMARIPQAAPDRALPTYEVIHIVRAHGLDPLDSPMLHGVTYRTRAVDRAGREVNVVVDARYGDVLLVEAADGPYPERRIAGVPPGYYDPNYIDAPPSYSGLDTYPARNPPANPPRVITSKPRVAAVPAQKRPPLPKAKPEIKPEAVASQSAAPVPTQAAPAAAPPAPKAETTPAKDAPTKWKDEPTPTNAPAAAPKVPDVAPLE